MSDIGSIDMRDITLENGIKSLSRGVSSKKAETDSTSKTTFSDILKKSVMDVDTMQKDADMAVSELVAGDNKNIHGTMINLEKADISFRLMVQVRNKIIDAYKEVMRMNI